MFVCTFFSTTKGVGTYSCNCYSPSVFLLLICCTSINEMYSIRSTNRKLHNVVMLLLFFCCWVETWSRVISCAFVNGKCSVMWMFYHIYIHFTRGHVTARDNTYIKQNNLSKQEENKFKALTHQRWPPYTSQIWQSQHTHTH